MTQVLAVLGGGTTEAPVIETAAALAEIAHARVRQVSLPGDLSAERAAAQLLGALHSPGSLLAVMARDERSIWRRVAQRSARPVVLVPAAARGRRPEIRRVLLPLDGTAESAAAVAGTVEQFASAGVDLVVLHVFDAETVPRFWDQAAHAVGAWTEEFLARYCAQPGVRLEIRTGVAGEHVLDVAEAERADTIALGWSQQLDPGRARTVRRAVLDAVVPVMLVPAVSEGRDVGPYRQAEPPLSHTSMTVQGSPLKWSRRARSTRCCGHGSRPRQDLVATPVKWIPP